MDNSGSTPAPAYTSQQNTPSLLREASDPSEKAPQQQQDISVDVDEPSSEQLSVMVADKDIAALQKLGGTNALLSVLNVDIDTGLVPEDRTTAAATAADPDAGRPDSSKKIELAKELAAQQDSAEVTWLADFENDCKLYADRVERYGVNILPPAKSRSFLGLVWDALHDKMLILLIVAAIVSLGIGIYQDVRVTGDKTEDSQNVHWVEGFAIIVAIAVVTLVASINDYQKEKQFRRLNAKKNDRKVRLTRGGQERLVSTNCVLVGDILHIEPGDILCADGIVVSSSNLKCDESSVTGESDAMKKSRLEDAEKASADRKNRRQRRRAELRTKRNEQRTQAYRLKVSGGKADEAEISELLDKSGLDLDDSTDGEDLAVDKATGIVIAPAATLDAGADADIDEIVDDSHKRQAVTSRRPKGGHSSKKMDPFLISGSRVLEGVGRCVVVAVGEKSFYGRTLMSLRTKSDPTPLQQKLDGLAELIAKLGGAAGLLMFIVLIIKYFIQFGKREVSRNATKVVDSVVRIVISAVTVVVVAVPEGLPLAVTLALAVATTRMLKDNCLVRVLASCETMGNATTICSDKTGTLTQNRMTVVAGCIGDQYQFSSYPPGTSELQRRRAKQPPADGLVTDMTGRAVPPEKAVLPTLLETETRRQRRLRNRRNRQHRRRMGRASGYSSSSALTPTSDVTPSFSGVSDMSDYSDDDDMIVPTAELGEEAPLAVLNLCYDAIAVNSSAFIAASDNPVDRDADSDDGLLSNTATGKKTPFWRRLLGRSSKRSRDATASSVAREESNGESGAAATSADKFTGSKTEVAMLSWSESLGAPDYVQLREKDIEQCVQVWPFSSERKAMSTLVRIRRREDDKLVWRLYVKGAPEIVVQDCRWIVDVDGAFQTQDHAEIINDNLRDTSFYGSIADADNESEELTPTNPRADIPQINLDHGSDDDDEDGDSDGNSENGNIAGALDEPYLLSAHYTGSRNAGSDTTDVGEDALPTTSFPADFAHNPAVPVLPLDEETLHDLRRTISDYASRALRTIGVAYRDFETFDEASLAQLESDVEWRESAGLVCLGIFAIEDPLRDGVTDAVRRCQNAGIIVRMVTGDNVLTARAIATQCGIFTPGMGGIVLEGPKFRKLTPEQMDFIIPRLQVLARSSPEDKRMLVEWLRTHGEVVSVTGDGTNDGPALKAASVGFSMGIAGTEVAKEASSIVLMDDNFKSIVRACMWGRTVNDAVKKFLQFQLTVNITAVLIAFVSSIADKEEKSVFTAVQLLWINLIMDTFAALALATDPPSGDILDRYPEKQGSPLITFTMWKNIIGQSILQVVVCFLTLYAADDIFHLHTVQSSQDMLVLRTLVFNTFAWMQIFNEFNCRVLHNELNCFKGIQKNWFFMIIVLISVVGQVIIVQWGGVAFQTTALGGKYWAFSIVAGFISLPVGLILRLIPDQLIWWLLPFVSQDIYKQPQSLEWQPPAQNVRSKLAGESGNNQQQQQQHDGSDGRPDDGGYSSDDIPATHGQGDGIKSSVARLGATISRRIGKAPRHASRSHAANSEASAKQRRHWKKQYRAASVSRQTSPNNGAASDHQAQLTVDTQATRPDQDVGMPAFAATSAAADAAAAVVAPKRRQDVPRKRSGSNEAKPKSILAAAMVPSMVASSIGIGMSTSAMPPNKMTIEELVDQELEKQQQTEQGSQPKSE
ncbi:plasma membrane calcium [Coemansia interrupta]|uniref:Calcium-transporting ATPase n=1 Tax=Coemansia interrupta TaxID=1126814 RepID=A0A9W8HM26_9FUNG|nr:plasma membrane calcium [Coemansia interrupta]